MEKMININRGRGGHVSETLKITKLDNNVFFLGKMTYLAYSYVNCNEEGPKAHTPHTTQIHIHMHTHMFTHALVVVWNSY